MDVVSLRLFLRVSDLQGVSVAARDMGFSPASASARLAKLESQLGFRLFHRTTRAVSLTSDGAEFVPYAQQALESLETGIHMVRGVEARVQGLLKMTMPGSFGRMHVVPLLEEFSLEYPRLTLDLRMSDEVLDVVEGAYDLILRNAPLAESSFIARKLAPDRRLLLASPRYLDRCGVPVNLEDLTHHANVVLGDGTRLKFGDGSILHVPGTFRVNDGEAMRMMIEEGMGIGVSSVWNAGDSIRSGRLVEVLPAHPLATESAIWALYPSRRLVPPKVRAMIDFLLQRFGPTPPWEFAS